MNKKGKFTVFLSLLALLLSLAAPAQAAHLAFVEVQKDGVGGVDGLGYAYRVAVSPDGAHVYAAGYLDDAVAVFKTLSAATPAKL